MSTYRREWDCCGSVTETDAWEPEFCPFCVDAVCATPSPANGALGEMPELPEPFFYYEANSDESVAWNEGCVCVDDVYTNARYAAENETHGGKVFNAAQMQAYARAAVLAERAAILNLVLSKAYNAAHLDDSKAEGAYSNVASAIRART